MFKTIYFAISLKETNLLANSSAQVLDLGGMSAMQMVSHMRNQDAQQEWQHNLDFHPEVLHKVMISR